VTTPCTCCHDELLARDIGYDAALASLDLAKLYLQLGRTAEVKHLARQMVTVFQEQGVHREALAAVRLFQEAAERERASVELVRRLADYLRRARHDAALRFTGDGSAEGAAPGSAAAASGARRTAARTSTAILRWEEGTMNAPFTGEGRRSRHGRADERPRKQVSKGTTGDPGRHQDFGMPGHRRRMMPRRGSRVCTRLGRLRRQCSGEPRDSRRRGASATMTKAMMTRDQIDRDRLLAKIATIDRCLARIARRPRVREAGERQRWDCLSPFSWKLHTIGGVTA